MHSEITHHINAVCDSLSRLRELFDDPSNLSLQHIASDVARLERSMAKKAFVDAAFAQVCVNESAGRLVGANYPDAYLMEKLGLSKGEAYNRLARAKSYFQAPGPGPEEKNLEDFLDDLFGPDAEPSEEERAAAEAAARAQAEEDAERRRKEQEEAKQQADEISAEKQDIIRRELDKLLKAAQGEYTRILARAMAMEEAKFRGEKDLRAFVQRLVREANQPHVKKNPNAGFEKRDVRVGNRNGDGTVDITITATAGHAALIKAHLDLGLAPNSNLPEDQQDQPDTRTKGTRRFDQFWKIFTQFEAEQQRLNGGAASVVLSVTLDDLADADASTLFQTNTGIELDPFDVVRLGTDGTADFVLTLDGLTGEPLHLGRSRRCASIGQRIAMLAIQGVCSWAGCTTSMSECEAHHILSWLRGGNTDITNLTGLCREHHRCNNDHRDGSFNKGYMEYDPSSGRSYLQRPGSGHRHFNTTDAASRSSWNRIRSRKQPPKCQCAPAPPPVHHPTPMRP